MGIYNFKDFQLLPSPSFLWVFKGSSRLLIFNFNARTDLLQQRCWIFENYGLMQTRRVQRVFLEFENFEKFSDMRSYPFLNHINGQNSQTFCTAVYQYWIF
ncbi:hypothetical protein B9Z55_021669 [Caenorhabditis nigoni]|uniref:Uncharacterized protein n=1 Tax=Caenorhabditis nigoni TaxID=1611254 RepID=A0A2G5TT44_9PELO|nr:hypothetical protein B9Z55_021669 [Caenorhabditis nigoni]